MPRYLNPEGRGIYGIGICARCSRKFFVDELYTDPNNGLRVCKEDIDIFDPWRLPSRRDEVIALRYPRPDVPLTVPEE